MAREQNEKLYEAYYMRVFSYAMTLTGDRGQAEKIARETFFRAFSKQSELTRATDEAAWLCAAAKEIFQRERRRQSKAAPGPREAPDTGKSDEQSAAQRNTSFRIHAALHTLEEPYREVFELRVFGELSFIDVGLIFGKTENWARVTYHRARLKLQERMDEHEL